MPEPVSTKLRETPSPRTSFVSEQPVVSAGTQFAKRLSLVVALPLLLSAGVFIWLLTDFAYTRAQAQSTLMGQAIADQLAISLDDHLVNEDILSLNVVLSELTARGNFDFASVYSADNRLLAQTGQRGETGDSVVFTRDITFQNVTVGYVRIGFEKADLYRNPARLLLVSLLALAVTVSLCVAFIFRYRAKVRRWLYGGETSALRSSEPAGEWTEQDAGAGIDIETTEIKTVCVLVLRIRPVRLAANYQDTFARALSLYGGVTTNTDGNDISAVFSADEQIFHAIYGGLLVKSMIQRIGSPMKFNGGVHTASANDFSAAQKHASHLASIAENRLLTSHSVFDKVAQNNTIIAQEFHSSLTPDGEVYSVLSLTDSNQALIDRQAERLLQSTLPIIHLR